MNILLTNIYNINSNGEESDDGHLNELINDVLWQPKFPIDRFEHVPTRVARGLEIG